MGNGGTPDRRLLDAIARTDVEATEVLARWVATGREPSREEMSGLGVRGLLVDELSLAVLVKGCLAWRDVTTAVLEQEAAEVGAGAELTAEVSRMIARSCDASLVSMAGGFDGDRRRLEEKLAHLALYDSLTGLANRRLLSERLQQALRSAARYEEAVAVCHLDLDGFKAVNEVFGHRVGDQLLQALAHRLSEIARSSDMAARVGGDEFVVLRECLHGGAEDAAAVAERVLARVREPYLIDRHEVLVSASVGVALDRKSVV